MSPCHGPPQLPLMVTPRYLNSVGPQPLQEGPVYPWWILLASVGFETLLSQSQDWLQSLGSKVVLGPNPCRLVGSDGGAALGTEGIGRDQSSVKKGTCFPCLT
jgi:hypothetical protein